MNENTPRLVARWETRGNDYLQLMQDGPGSYCYEGLRCYGSFRALNDADAIDRMQAPWNDPRGAGAVTVLQSDRPSLRRVR